MNDDREKMEEKIDADEEESEIQRLRRLLNESERLRQGTYYSEADQVWDNVNVSYERSHFCALLRSKCPSVYQATYVAAVDEETEVKDDKQSSRTSESPKKREKIWPTDIFGRENQAAQVAHLIPASPTHGDTYDDVAALAMGLTPETILPTNAARRRDPFEAADTLASIKKKAIHGAKAKYPTSTDASKTTKRSEKVGLKHLVHNKIRLLLQGTYYDTNPCVLIVPVMTLEQVKEWDGNGYSAIVLVASFENMDAAVVSATIGMQYLEPVEIVSAADEEDIENARVLLQQALCGLAFSLFRDGRPVTDLITKYRRDFFTVDGSSTVNVPAPKQVENGVQVKMVKFGVLGYHPAPDPLLLLFKAANNWGRLHRQRLLAGGEPADDDDDRDSLSIQAEEEYIERYEESLRPKTWNDLAAGLGQPDGYRPKTVDV